VSHVLTAARFLGPQIKRHALGRAAAHGGFSSFPSVLEPMRRELALAGPRSFEMEEDGYYTVNLDTMLCDCLASHYHGVRSAHELCPHARLADLVRQGSSSDEAAAEVRKHAFEVLLQPLIYKREQSKSEAERCHALYEANTEEELLQALELFASFPPVGTCTGLDDLSAEPISVQTTAAPIFECTFPNGGELGICFTVESFGWEYIVASYLPLRRCPLEGPAPLLSLVSASGLETSCSQSTASTTKTCLSSTWSTVPTR
jgi:hypothetical protein